MPDTQTVDLKKFSIERPERVRWILPQTNDVLSLLKSQSARSFLQKAETLLAEQNITWTYHELSKAEYESWLSYYRENMKQLGFDILAKLEWFEEMKTAGSIVEGLFFHQNGKLIGSAIIERHGTEFASEKFKASDRINLSSRSNSSLGLVIDYFFLREMKKLGVQVITAGRCRNLFGIVHTVGYLEYKLRFGYEAVPEKDTALLTDVPLNEEGYVLFYGMHSGKLALYLLVPPAHDTILQKVNALLADTPKHLISY